MLTLKKMIKGGKKIILVDENGKEYKLESDYPFDADILEEILGVYIPVKERKGGKK